MLIYYCGLKYNIFLFSGNKLSQSSGRSLSPFIKGAMCSQPSVFVVSLPWQRLQRRWPALWQSYKWPGRYHPANITHNWRVIGGLQGSTAGLSSCHLIELADHGQKSLSITLFNFIIMMSYQLVRFYHYDIIYKLSFDPFIYLNVING